MFPCLVNQNGNQTIQTLAAIAGQFFCIGVLGKGFKQCHNGGGILEPGNTIPCSAALGIVDVLPDILQIVTLVFSFFLIFRDKQMTEMPMHSCHMMLKLLIKHIPAFKAHGECQKGLVLIFFRQIVGLKISMLLEPVFHVSQESVC